MRNSNIKSVIRVGVFILFSFQINAQNIQSNNLDVINSILPNLAINRPELTASDRISVWRDASRRIGSSQFTQSISSMTPQTRTVFDQDPRYQEIVLGAFYKDRGLPASGKKSKSSSGNTIFIDQTPFVIDGVASEGTSTLLLQVTTKDNTAETCSASLVSRTAVVTAVHCVCQSSQTPRFKFFAKKRVIGSDGLPRWEDAGFKLIDFWPTYPSQSQLKTICADLPIPPPSPVPPWYLRDTFRSQGDLAIFRVPADAFPRAEPAYGVVPRELVGRFLTLPGVGNPGFGLARIVGWGPTSTGGTAGQRNEGSVAGFICSNSEDEQKYGCVQQKELIVARFAKINNVDVAPTNGVVPCTGDSGGPVQLIPAKRWASILNVSASEAANKLGVAERWIAGVTSRRVSYQDTGSYDECGDGGLYWSFGPEALSALKNMDVTIWSDPGDEK